MYENTRLFLYFSSSSSNPGRINMAKLEEMSRSGVDEEEAR